MNKGNNGNQMNNKDTKKVYNFQRILERYGKNILATILAISVIILTLLLIYFYQNPPATVVNGEIRRPISQLLRYLDEVPADISSEPYEETIPDVVRADIQKVLESNGELSALYYGADKEFYITIEKDDYSDKGIKLEIWGFSSYQIEIELRNHISMYKSGNNIVIYGSYWNERAISGYELWTQSGECDYILLENLYMDLYGTNFDKDNIWYVQEEMSLVRTGNDFAFYRLGEQVGKTVRFPGGKITNCNDYCILDDNNDMYYMYFCSHPENAWIKFVKVDSNVSKLYSDVSAVIPEDMMETEDNLLYPIYMKNGKKYVGVSNAETEKVCGQDYGIMCSDNLDESTFDFDIAILELTEANISSITITREQESHMSGRSDWYVRYNYIAKGQTLYFEERINGLDAYLTTIIPEKEMKKFEGREVSPEQLKDVVEELKQLYDKFSTQKSLN